MEPPSEDGGARSVLELTLIWDYFNGACLNVGIAIRGWQLSPTDEIWP